MATRIQVEIDESTLRKIILGHLQGVLDVALKPEDVRIEVKSKQNYKSEWESAQFRATVDKVVLPS
jgi:hypothetical protein